MPLCSSEGHLPAVLMLMAGLSRILQSQPGCFHSASHDFSSSNKLTPAGLHGSWQNSERERERKCGRSPKDWAQLSYSIMANTPGSQSKLRESQDEGRRKTGSSLEVRSCKART